ncbi:hypothetical protein G6O69_09515 [Pseudenhygromyxa sp. WMMC2535]|uniref:hypothetical protein n=1 Tax=Pseudenhygromyxa sp. WMMC2535 TaxID=2712867 RepID=UPI001555AD00|nr:hypothetical protein [Pseudenhygromyxa sp. WMMC2535]NVB38069.1 hypothetical protein [Pseudenhygromyxa sp. WMMC2535]
MSDTEDPKPSASIGYAFSRLERALKTATSHADADVRARARARHEAWARVVEGMAGGRLQIGSRTPVADTPAWVTLEVVHGGFATGRYLAEGELRAHELALLDTLSAPGKDTPRARLNAWYLGDAGQAQLAAAVDEGRLEIAIPEEAALPVVAALLARGREPEALELIATLGPLMHRLRFYPRLRATPVLEGGCVRRRSVAEVASMLRATRPKPQVAAMTEALGIWNPLYDRLVELWLETLDPEDPAGRPRLRRGDDGQLLRGEHGQPLLAGGWPGSRDSAAWWTRRAAWLSDYRAAAQAHALCGKHRRRKSNFSRLREALEAAESVRGRGQGGLGALGARLLGGVRLALANTLSKHGAPGSGPREALRRAQAEIAARPGFAQIAVVIADRVARYPGEGGLPTLEGFDDPISSSEAAQASIPAGTRVPSHLSSKLANALEAPIPALIERGVISSSEVLAELLPQITAQICAAGLDDPGLRGLFAQTYAAFRRRRSLLLLDLSHQVRLEELPWIAALEPLRRPGLDGQREARQTLEQLVMSALCGFPQTIVPNVLTRELEAVAKRAGLELPLVQELAVDIFMGTFTAKWPEAAREACERLEGKLYARYYDLPSPRDEALHAPRGVGKAHAEQAGTRFAALCKQRSSEARIDPQMNLENCGWLETRGSQLEQCQILTTHNLATLTWGLGLEAKLAKFAAELAARCFAWILGRRRQRAPNEWSRQHVIKNAGYAWRQAIFWLSLCSESEQGAALNELERGLAAAPGVELVALAQAVSGLRMVLEGGRFDAEGRGPLGERRFLGWGIGGHWITGQARGARKINW